LKHIEFSGNVLFERKQVDKMGNMETKQTKWEELSISNDFLFGKVMQNPELCKELLQRILPDLNIERIEYPELQKNINVDMDAHSVRLDVYVKDDKETVYDIEIQVSDTKELPKRSRYYQGMIDLQLVDAGQHYKKLNRSYIIFICPFDLYGKGRHIYTFENICKEDNSISMGDEAIKIFLNADGTMDDVSRELKAFLDYVSGQKPEDSYVEKLEKAVQEAKKNREWRHEYMTLLMRDQENVEKGKEYGEELMAKLIMLLNEDGRLSDIVRVSQDKEYRQSLYLEYHII
jgi:predicted transposase/invertase (TIGR01784 family)